MLGKLLNQPVPLKGFHTGLTWLDDHSQLYDKLRTVSKDGGSEQDAECKTRIGVFKIY